jgi:hypothetical protein
VKTRWLATFLLPAWVATPATAGAWPCDDGMPSRLRIAWIAPITSPAGTLQDCLQVVREFLEKGQAEQFSQETYTIPTWAR